MLNIGTLENQRIPIISNLLRINYLTLVYGAAGCVLSKYRVVVGEADSAHAEKASFKC